MKQTITICIIDSTGFKETDRFLSNFFFMEKDEKGSEYVNELIRRGGRI